MHVHCAFCVLQTGGSIGVANGSSILAVEVEQLRTQLTAAAQERVRIERMFWVLHRYLPMTNDNDTLSRKDAIAHAL